MFEESGQRASSLAISVGAEFSCVCFDLKNSDPSDGGSKKKNRVISTKCSTETLEETFQKILDNNADLNFNKVFLIGPDSGNWAKRLQVLIKTKFSTNKDISNYAATGCNFLLKNISDEAFEINSATQEFKFISTTYKFHPYLLLVKGQFIEFLKVSPSEFSLLGKSYFNLQQMLSISKGLTGTKDLVEFMNLLKSSPIFEKIMKTREDNFMKTMIEVKEIIFSYTEAEVEDKPYLAWYIFWLWCSNVTQLALLHCQNNKIKNVVLSEGWSHTQDYLEILNIFFKFYSGSKLKIIFLRHSGYTSSLGALLNKKEDFQLSWRENYILSSGCTTESLNHPQTLILDEIPSKLAPSPLLKDPSSYDPLTQNLYTDEESREYWIQCVTDNIRGGINNKMTAESCTPKQIAFYKFQDMMMDKLNYIKQHP